MTVIKRVAPIRDKPAICLYKNSMWKDILMELATGKIPDGSNLNAGNNAFNENDPLLKQDLLLYNFYSFKF